MDEIYIIGDVHGHYNELISLIIKLPNKFDSKICFVGDLIDRGPDSKKVVDLVKQRGYDCVMGNHELMCIEFRGNPYNMTGGYSQSTLNPFGSNGGVLTLDSYGNLELLQKDIEYFKTLPYYKIYDIKNKDGKKLIVSHSCILNYMDSLDNEFVMMGDMVWNRDIMDKEIPNNKDFFNVFGHTITDEVIQNHKYASIETGVARERGGKLSCIAYPSMKIYQSGDLK